MQVLRGRNECVGIDIKPAPNIDPRPLLSSDLRKLPFLKMIDKERRTYLEKLGNIHRHRVDVAEQLVREGKLPEESMSRFVTGIKDFYSGELMTGAGAEIRGRVSRRGGRPKLYDDAHYQKVAAVYRAAWAAGKYPRLAVADAFQESPSAAGKWISKCREKGLLPPTTRGQVSAEPVADVGKLGR
jgi:hypothetical protein